MTRDPRETTIQESGKTGTRATGTRTDGHALEALPVARHHLGVAAAAATGKLLQANVCGEVDGGRPRRPTLHGESLQRRQAQAWLCCHDGMPALQFLGDTLLSQRSPRVLLKDIQVALPSNKAYKG